MSTHLKRSLKNEIYFVTFTCHDWLPLFDKSNTYSYCKKWFTSLKENNCAVLGYVIMPNHFHGIFYVQEGAKLSINQLVSNGKRFWAYEIVRQLKKLGHVNLINFLQKGVSGRELKIGKKHQVFRPSFDSKICYSRKMVETKLDYIHNNPVKGKWNLASNVIEYAHSSAVFYCLQTPNSMIKHYMDVI